MNLAQSFIEALESLAGNKVRSGLTMLGIIIGVAAVIAMMAIGAGAQSSITGQVESIGVNLLYVVPGGEATNPQPLTLADAAAIANPQLAPDVLHVAPVIQGRVSVSVPGEELGTSLMGITPEFFQVQNADVSYGQMISQQHVDDYAPVVLLGTEVADELFDRTSDLIGEKVRIDGQVFKVIGVLEEQGGGAMGSSDDRVLVPLSTAQLRLLKRDAPDEVDTLYVQAASSEQVEAAQEQLTQILRARHTRNLGEDDFEIMSTEAFLEIITAITSTFTLFLGGVAGVSLLVGGIGIMNIMLVTVSERTREIGLRKALGARRRDIRLQFLVESALLSLFGGALGILLGWGIATLIGQIAASSGTELTPLVELNAVLLATMFSAAVGLFFGLYPANRAAGLEPVEALRVE